ncbi:MAG: response regulator [Candidatus Bathyarchaeota archaeon]|nr:response regulator [Candidatus Bathyarchaeota archaeon]
MTITDCYEECTQGKSEEKIQDRVSNDKRLLFVDDDLAILDGYRYIFEDEGYLVDVACNQSELNQCLETYDYDTIILDYHLGQLNGVELAKQINKVKPEVRLVFISGQKNAKEELINNRVSVAGFFLKPIKAEVLLEYISGTLME